MSSKPFSLYGRPVRNYFNESAVPGVISRAEAPLPSEYAIPVAVSMCATTRAKRTAFHARELETTTPGIHPTLQRVIVARRSSPALPPFYSRAAGDRTPREFSINIPTNGCRLHGHVLQEQKARPGFAALAISYFHFSFGFLILRSSTTADVALTSAEYPVAVFAPSQPCGFAFIVAEL